MGPFQRTKRSHLVFFKQSVRNQAVQQAVGDERLSTALLLLVTGSGSGGIIPRLRLALGSGLSILLGLGAEPRAPNLERADLRRQQIACAGTRQQLALLRQHRVEHVTSSVSAIAHSQSLESTSERTCCQV